MLHQRFVLVVCFCMGLFVACGCLGQLSGVPPLNLAITNLANGSFTISGSGVPGDTYGLEFADNLTQTNWQMLRLTNADPTGFFMFLDSDDSPKRFYRAVLTNILTSFSPTNIPGMAYYWDFRDLPYNVATTGWTDRLQNAVLTNYNPSIFNPTNSALGLMLPNSGSDSDSLTTPTIAIGSNFTLWMVIRERLNLQHDSVPKYACLFGASGGPYGLMLSNGVIGCDWGNATGTIGGVMMSNWPIDLVYSQGQVYTNGVALNGALPQPTNAFQFQTVGDIVPGGTGHNPAPFQGYIQYIGIWTNTLFSAADVSNLDAWVNTNGVSNITGGLTAWWKMNDAAGETVFDSTGNGFAGSITGGQTWLDTAPTGGGLSFNGSTFVLTSLTNGPGLSSNFTVAYWMQQPHDSTYPQQIPIAKAQRVANSPGWSAWLESAWMRMTSFDATNWIEMNDQDIVTDGRWHLIIWTMGANPNIVAQYNDGELQIAGVQFTGAVGNCANTNPVTFGSSQGGYTPFYTGALADARVYTNHVFTAQEAALLFRWRGQP